MIEKSKSESTYRAWVIPEHGGIDVLRLDEKPLTEPGWGQVRIKTVRGALNHLDLWVRQGVQGHKFPIPLIPISDITGVVDSVGPNVESLSVGTRVVLYPGASCGVCPECLAGNDPFCQKYGIRGETFDGGASEYLIAGADECVPLPDSMSWDIAAAFGLTFLTAWRMVFTRGKVQPGEWVLVHAAGSGVSSAAIQFCKMIGARVIATAGSLEKIKAAEKYGIEKVINYKEADFSKEIRELTDKRGVDLIIDHIGKDTFAGNIKSLAKGGRIVTCGNTSGAIVEMNIAPIFFKSLAIIGSTMGSRAEFHKCLDIVSRGLATPVIDRIFPFDDLPKAHEYLESRKAFGKVLIAMPE